MMLHQRMLPERWQCRACLAILVLMAFIFTVFGICFTILGMRQGAIGFFAAAVLVVLYITSFVASRFFNHFNNIDVVPQGQQNLDQGQQNLDHRDHPLTQQVIRGIPFGPPHAPAPAPAPAATHGHDQNVEMVPMTPQR